MHKDKSNATLTKTSAPRGAKAKRPPRKPKTPDAAKKSLSELVDWGASGGK